MGTQIERPPHDGASQTGAHTQIRQSPDVAEAGLGGFAGSDAATGKTIIKSQQQPAADDPASGQTHCPQNPVSPGRTTIRRVNSATGQVLSEGRRLVGFLVCYSRYPQGKAFNLYEGRNYVGRDSSCEICIPEDNQLSGRHMSIVYRSVDDKFKFRDELSSNGTFINKQLLDEGELQNYDIVRVGSTLFVFIAIPQIG